MVAVLAIMLVISLLAVARFSTSLDAKTLAERVTPLRDMLRSARWKTLNSGILHRVGFDSATRRWTDGAKFWRMPDGLTVTGADGAHTAVFYPDGTARRLHLTIVDPATGEMVEFQVSAPTGSVRETGGGSGRAAPSKNVHALWEKRP